MQAALLAAVHPDNTPHGYNLTFAFPMLMFIIVAGALYLILRGPHEVPGHVALASSRWARAASAGAAGQPQAAPAAGTPAAAAAPAAGPTGAESANAEPAQAKPEDAGAEDGE